MCDDIDTSVDTADYDSSDIDTSDVDTYDTSYDDSNYEDFSEDMDDSNYDDNVSDEIEDVPEDSEDFEYEETDYSDDSEEIPEDIENSDYDSDTNDELEDVPEDVDGLDYSDEESFSEIEEIDEDIEDSYYEDIDESDFVEDIPEDVGSTTEEGVEDTDDEAVNDTAEDNLEDTAEEAIDDTTEDGVEDTAVEAVDDTTEDGVEDTADEAFDDTTEDGVEDTADEAIDDTTEDGVEDTADEAVDDTAEDDLEDTADEAVDDTAEDNLEDTADEAVDDTAEDDFEDTVDEAVDDTTEDSVEDTADEAVDDSAEEGVEDTADETVDDSAEEIVENTTNEVVDDSVGEDIEDITVEPVANSTEEDASEILNEEWSQSEEDVEDVSQDVKEKTPQQKLVDYMTDHNYGREDFNTYSQDPEWRALQKEAYPDYEMPPLSQESASKQLYDYMAEHNYGRDDYDTYSQDQKWQELHSVAFPENLSDLSNKPIDSQPGNMTSLENNKVDNESGKSFSENEYSESFGNFEVDKHINGSEFFIKGDNYEKFKQEYYSPEESTYEKFDEPKEIEISPNDIEGIHISQHDMDEPSAFWSQHEKDGSCESFKEIAKKIPEIKEQLDNGITLEELSEDPELSKCANIYFKNKPKVIQRDGYYEFDSNGRHRILAAREAGQNIPVEVIGKRESVSELNNDGTDWSHTSNTPEQEKILKEMEENGEIEIPEINDDLLDPQQGTLHLPTVNSGDIVGERDSGNFEFIPKSPDVIDHMNLYGRSSVEYKDGYPDFSPFTTHETPWGKVECNVEIPHMTDQRNNPSLEYGARRIPGTSHQPGNELGNFTQADNEVVKKLQNDYPDLTADEFQKYRESNKLTWHECPDGKTMQLVPTDIHNACRHSGGVAEMKYHMSWGDITRPIPGEE